MSMQEIKAALAALEDAEGRLTPEAVVAAAKDKASVLHPYFEWNNSKAAEQYRIIQAEALIRRVRVKYEHTEYTATVPVMRLPPGADSKVPLYYRDPRLGSRERGYVALSALEEDSDDARTVVLREFAQAAGHLQRARTVAAALSMQGDVDRLLGDLLALRERAETTAAQQPQASAA